MNSSFKGLSRLFSLLVVSVVAVAFVGCGSSNDLENFVRNNTTTPVFTGQFLGANNLANNQTSNLSFTVNSNGQATGNLTVVNPVSSQTITPGTYPVTGNVSLTTGVFSLTGTIPGLGTFSITGTLPSNGNVGSYTITINNQTFNGIIQPASQGQPSAPGAGNGNGTGTGNSQLISGGTLSNFVFNPDGSYNGDNPPVNTGSTISGAVGEGTDGSESASIVISEIQLTTPVRTRTFIVTIKVPNGEDLQVGTTYPLASTSGRGVVIAVSESEGTTAVEGWSLVEATTGSATITARDANSITINFEFSNVGPNSEIANNPATGTFSTSGTVTGNFANIP